jgi:hypothetical protein
MGVRQRREDPDETDAIQNAKKDVDYDRNEDERETQKIEKDKQ